MALLFIDSCGDHLAAGQVTQKWNSGSISAVVPGFTGKAYQNPQALSIGLPVGSKLLTVGGRYNFSTLASGLFSPYDTGNPECSVGINTDGSISVTNASASQPVTIHSAAGLLQTGVWYYIEAQILMDTGLAGTMTVRLNGIPVIQATGLKTANGFGGSPFLWTAIKLSSSTSGIGGLVDDFYILDGSGATFNTWLGAIQIQALFPNANGDQNDWTPLAGQNFQEVNETNPDGDTSYNSTTTLNALDLFTVPALDPSLNVLAVQRLINAKQTAGGTEGLAGAAKFGGSVTLGPNVGLGTVYGYANRDILMTAPDGSPWTNAKFNATQWGYEKTI